MRCDFFHYSEVGCDLSIGSGSHNNNNNSNHNNNNVSSSKSTGSSRKNKRKNFKPRNITEYAGSDDEEAIALRNHAARLASLRQEAAQMQIRAASKNSAEEFDDPENENEPTPSDYSDDNKEDLSHYGKGDEHVNSLLRARGAMFPSNVETPLDLSDIQNGKINIHFFKSSKNIRKNLPSKSSIFISFGYGCCV